MEKAETMQPLQHIKVACYLFGNQGRVSKIEMIIECLRMCRSCGMLLEHSHSGKKNMFLRYNCDHFCVGKWTRKMQVMPDIVYNIQYLYSRNSQEITSHGTLH